MKAFL